MRRFTAIPAVIFALALLPLVGCATGDSDEISAEEYSEPRELIRAAQEVGAEDNPRANLFLGYATEQLQAAEQAREQGNYDRARLLLARAEADADLALTLAQEGRLAQQVDQIDERIERIRRETPRE